MQSVSFSSVQVIVALTEWGDKWSAPEEPPIIYEHSGCGGGIQQLLSCKSCKRPVKVKNVLARKTKAMTIYKERIAKERKNSSGKLKAVWEL